MARPHKAGAAREIGRMEAFSDAVFAIAITLPIVELGAPELQRGMSLAAALEEKWPTYLAYGLSFLVIGVWWVHHHFTGKIYARADHGFVLMNLVFLAVVGFVPYPTRLFTEHLGDPTRLPTAALVYTIALAVPTWAWLAKWLYALKTRAMDQRLDDDYLRRLTLTYGVTAALTGVAVVLSLFDWRLGLGLVGLVTLYHLRAPAWPIYETDAQPHQHPAHDQT
ncbi:MAG: TMEM175 family protein [Phenylobacterium sp.]